MSYLLESGIPIGFLSVRRYGLVCKMWDQPTEGNLEQLSLKYFMRKKWGNLSTTEFVSPDVLSKKKFKWR
ncbi:hypothetical protein TNCV_2861981 [Trichonephila clavipes]|nr:hypothetical protein TNCV_2861981 [Trichonephila clavipes]